MLDLLYVCLEHHEETVFGSLYRCAKLADELLDYMLEKASTHSSANTHPRRHYFRASLFHQQVINKTPTAEAATEIYAMIRAFYPKINWFQLLTSSSVILPAAVFEILCG